MLAFAAENYDTGAPLSDPRYVRWVYGVADNAGNGTNNYFYPLRKCTDDEFGRFDTPKDEVTATKVQHLQAGGNFFCLDLRKMDYDLRGSETSGTSFTALDPMLVPCASRITLFDGSVLGGHDDCVWDKDAVEKYMSSSI